MYTHLLRRDINNCLFITDRALMIAENNQAPKIQLGEMCLLGFLTAHV